MKRIIKKLIIFYKTNLCLISVLVVAACGTMNVNVNTTVDNIDSFSHQATITATGFMAGLMFDSDEGLNLEKLQSIGWDVTTETVGDELTIELSGVFEGETAANFLNMEPNDDYLMAGKFNVSQQDDGNYTVYRISLDMRDVVETEEPTNAEDESMIEGMDEMMAGMFTFNWKLKYPGELVDSNSDINLDNNATWHVNLKTMSEKGEMYLVTRVKNNTGGCN